MPEGLTIVAAADPRFRAGLERALAGGGRGRILEAGDLDGARALIAGNADVGLVFVDLAMPGVGGLPGLLALRGVRPAVPVVIVPASDDPAAARRALDLGASGAVARSAGAADIAGAVRTVLDGGVAAPGGSAPTQEADGETADLIARLRALTPQQARVLAMLAEGLLNKQIAYALNVSEATVKAHVSAILRKLDATGRAQAVDMLARLAAGPLPA